MHLNKNAVFLELTGSTVVCGMALAWQQMAAILIKRFHHSRRDWKGLISQILLPVFFVMFAMALGSIKNDLRNYPELELSPALYNVRPSYSFFRSVLIVQANIICQNNDLKKYVIHTIVMCKCDKFRKKLNQMCI